MKERMKWVLGFFEKSTRIQPEWLDVVGRVGPMDSPTYTQWLNALTELRYDNNET